MTVFIDFFYGQPEDPVQLGGMGRQNGMSKSVLLGQNLFVLSNHR